MVPTGWVVLEEKIFLAYWVIINTNACISHIYCQINTKWGFLLYRGPSKHHSSKIGSNQHSSILVNTFLLYQKQECLYLLCLCQIKTKWRICVEDFPNIITAKFVSNWQSSFIQRRLKYETFIDDGQRGGMDERRHTQSDSKSLQGSFSQVS